MMEQVASVNSENTGATIISAPREFNRIRINKWRVRDGYPVSASQVILLYEVLDGLGEQENEDADTVAAKFITKKLLKLKANKHGFVKKRLVKEGEIIQNGAALLELSDCIHTTVIKDMCADCGADLRQNENGNMHEASVPMVHSIPELKVTQKLAQKLGHDDTRRLLEYRKLVLLVDLDQTVIHTTNDNVPNNIKDIHHFQLYGPHSPWYHTRLRPKTPDFLETMSKYYELHICTFGARNYAHTIAQLLDPDGKFFSQRILSRDECFNATSKTDNLKALFPNGDSMVCIIDDREDVWNMASNLIQVKPYHFFQHTGDINAPPGLSKHELDGEGVDFQDLKKANTEDDDTQETIKDEDSNDATISKTEKTSTQAKASDSDESDGPSSSKKMKLNDEDEDLEQIDVENYTENENDLNLTQKNLNDLDGTKDNEVSNSCPKSATDGNEKENDVSTSAEKTKQSDKSEIKEDEESCDSKKVQIGSSTFIPIDDEYDNPKPGTSKNLYKFKDSENEKKKEKERRKERTPKLKVIGNSESGIEIEDPDDYLLYLEVILKNIHARFYKIYDETNEIPDLKIIVPKIRSEVLKGLNLVFSGLVPTNMKLEQSRAYFIAKSLGANVIQNINEETTHLVAVTAGTFKVMAARKYANIKIVNANWLWTCAERWEHVDERLFPLDRKSKNKQRHPPAHCHSPEHYVNYNDKSEISPSSSAQQHYAYGPTKFIDTINPLLSFSNADLADMNNEFDQFFQSDSSSDDEPVNIENPPVDKNLRKRKREEKEEDRTREFFSRHENNLLDANVVAPNPIQIDENGDPDGNIPNENLDDTSEDDEDKFDDDDDDDDDEMPSEKFRRGENLPSDLEMDSNSNDSGGNPDTEDDGEWNMMGAALEREFLGLEE